MRPECQEVPHAAKIRRQALAILSSVLTISLPFPRIDQWYRIPVTLTKYLTKGLVVSAAPSLALQNSTATNVVPEPLQTFPGGDSPPSPNRPAWSPIGLELPAARWQLAKWSTNHYAIGLESPPVLRKKNGPVVGKFGHAGNFSSHLVDPGKAVTWSTSQMIQQSACRLNWQLWLNCSSLSECLCMFLCLTSCQEHGTQQRLLVLQMINEQISQFGWQRGNLQWTLAISFQQTWQFAMISFSIKCLKPPFSICSSLEAQEANFATKSATHHGVPCDNSSRTMGFSTSHIKKKVCIWISANVRLRLWGELLRACSGEVVGSSKSIKMRLQHHLVADWWCSSPIWRPPCWCHGPGSKAPASLASTGETPLRRPCRFGPWSQISSLPQSLLPASRPHPSEKREISRYWTRLLAATYEEVLGVLYNGGSIACKHVFSMSDLKMATLKHMKLKRTLEWVLLKVLSTATCRHIAMWTKDTETLAADPKNQWWPLSSPNDQVGVVLEIVKSFIPLELQKSSFKPTDVCLLASSKS